MKPKIVYVEKDTENVIITEKALYALLDEFYNCGLKDGAALPKQQDLATAVAPPWEKRPRTSYLTPEEFKKMIDERDAPPPFVYDGRSLSVAEAIADLKEK